MMDLEKIITLSIVNKTPGIDRPSLARAVSVNYNLPKFDNRVALFTIDRLVEDRALLKEESKYYLTSWGYNDMVDAIQALKKIVPTL